MQRHLFYNLCAFVRNDEWKRNIDELAPHLDLFTGRRLVVVRTGPDIVPPEEVKAYFPGRAEFVCFPNNPRLGETANFIDMLETFYPATEDEALFYAHTKGVRYVCEPHKMVPVWRWRQTMLKECLKNIAKVEEVLKTKACCGTYYYGSDMKKERFRPLRPPRHMPWHYSGTFWWVNLKTLFSKPNWREIDQNYLAVENYLCKHISQDEAGRVGQPRGILYEILWAYTCHRCEKRFSYVTSNSSATKPPCPACKQPSVPDFCSYSNDVVKDYNFSPVTYPRTLSLSKIREL